MMAVIRATAPDHVKKDIEQIERGYDHLNEKLAEIRKIKRQLLDLENSLVAKVCNAKANPPNQSGDDDCPVTSDEFNGAPSCEKIFAEMLTIERPGASSAQSI